MENSNRRLQYLKNTNLRGITEDRNSRGRKKKATGGLPSEIRVAESRQRDGPDLKERIKEEENQKL